MSGIRLAFDAVMPERSPAAGLWALSLRVLLAACFFPMALGFARKVADFGRADILVSRRAAGYEARVVGPSAAPTGLHPGDVILLVDGREASKVPDPTRLLARSDAELTVLREGRPLRFHASASPLP